MPNIKKEQFLNKDDDKNCIIIDESNAHLLYDNEISEEEYYKEYEDKLITERNKELYNELSKKFTINLLCTNVWKTELEPENVAWIYFDESLCIEAKFTKELLYLDLLLKGFREVKTVLRNIENKPDLNCSYFVFLIQDVFKNLKIFKQYKMMGYSDEDFLGGIYGCVDEYGCVTHEKPRYGENLNLSEHQYYINRCNNNLSIALPYYLQLWDPANCVITVEINKLKEKYKSTSYISWVYFNEIDDLMYDWENSNSYDAEPYIRILLSKIFGMDNAWYGYGDESEFPEDGYFIGEPFYEYFE